MINRLLSRVQSRFIMLYNLHILNDGFEASFLLMLPFIANDLGLSFVQVGILGALANVFTILVALSSSAVAAKIGGLRVLWIALIIYACGLLGIAFAGHFNSLIIMFCLGGLGFGIFHPIAFSLVARWSTPQARGSAMGNFTAIGEIGKAALPAALTFLVVYIGWRHSAMLYGSLALVCAATIGFFIWRLSETTKTTAPKDTVVISWRDVISKRFLCATGVHFFDAIASSSLFVFLPFLLLDRGIPALWLGPLVAVFFIGSFIGKLYLGKLVDRFGSSQVLIAAELSMAVLILLLTITTWPPLIILLAIILGIFTKGTAPVVQTMVSHSAEPHGNFEKAFGIDALVSGFAITLAPLLLGIISNTFSVVIAFYCLATAAVLATLPAIGFAVLRRHEASA